MNNVPFTLSQVRPIRDAMTAPLFIWVVRETAGFFWESMGRKCPSSPEKCCMYRQKHCAAQKPTVE